MVINRVCHIYCMTTRAFVLHLYVGTEVPYASKQRVHVPTHTRTESVAGYSDVHITSDMRSSLQVASHKKPHVWRGR